MPRQNVPYKQQKESSFKKYPNIAFLNYRSTPHSATQVSPTEALVGTKLKRLPMLETKPFLEEDIDKSIRAADKKAKQPYKAAFDKRHGAKILNILEPGVCIFMRDGKQWRYGKIIEMADGSNKSYHIETDQDVYRGK